MQQSVTRRVFISSTSIEACPRIGYRPIGMGHWPAQDADAETVCLREVDEADLFVALYAFRCGWIPNRHHRSITELGYDRAKEKAKPRLLFIHGRELFTPAQAGGKG